MITDEEAKRALDVIARYCGSKQGSGYLDYNDCKKCVFYRKPVKEGELPCEVTSGVPCCEILFTGNTMKDDPVNHPSHYCQGGIETIDILKAKMPRPWFLGFLKGNVLKYITRSEFKGSEIEDFKKAAWYLDRLITEFEKDKEA